MGVVPCFGCTRWNEYDEPTQERVWIHTEPSYKRSTADLGGTVEHDGSGKSWFKPKRYRKHEFHLCTTCQQLFDRDLVFMEQVAQKATAMARGNE